MKKILVVITHRGMGDLIYLLPLLKSLHYSFNTKIDILSNKTNKAQYIYQNENFINSINNFNLNHKNLLFNFKEKRQILKKINSFKSDLLIITSRQTSMILPFHLCNAKQKVMFDLSNFYFKRKKTRNLLNCQKIYHNTKELKLKKFIKNFKLTKKKFTQNNAIFFNIDSHHNQNNWPVENFISLIEKIINKFKVIYINFSPKNKIIDNIISQKLKDKKIKVISKLKFSQVLKKIHESKIIVGNESGPICIGLSYNKKVISLYSPKHTSPESKIIGSPCVYFNTHKYSKKNLEKRIYKKILLLKKTKY